VFVAVWREVLIIGTPGEYNNKILIFEAGYTSQILEIR